MRPLSYLELKGMRDTVIDIETTPVQVWRRTAVPDFGGGQTDTYALSSTINGNYYKTSSAVGGGTERIVVLGERISVSESYIFTFPVRSNIQHADRLIADGLTFEVKSVSQTTDDLEIVMTVTADVVT